MAIIARRIPSPLGYVRAHTVRGGMGGAESCGPTQKWDPNYVFQGIKGQCVLSKQPLVPAPVAPSDRGVLKKFEHLPKGAKIAIGVGVVGLVAVILIATRTRKHK
jgi:hypothetical protein